MVHCPGGAHTIASVAILSWKRKGQDFQSVIHQWEVFHSWWSFVFSSRLFLSCFALVCVPAFCTAAANPLNRLSTVTRPTMKRTQKLGPILVLLSWSCPAITQYYPVYYNITAFSRHFPLDRGPLAVLRTAKAKPQDRAEKSFVADCLKHNATEYDFIPRTERRDASLLDDQAAEQCRYEIDF